MPRGPNWTKDETLDLLGDNRVQEMLRKSRTNIGTLKEVAEEMARRGHKKSAEQCRSRMTYLRAQYRKTRQANAISGSNRTTFDYYEELDQILRGDATLVPPRTANSSPLGPPRSPGSRQASSQSSRHAGCEEEEDKEEEEEEGDQEDEEDEEDPGEGTSATIRRQNEVHPSGDDPTQAGEEDQEEQDHEEQEGELDQEAEQPRVQGNRRPAGASTTGSGAVPRTPGRNTHPTDHAGGAPPGATMAELSPRTRLDVRRTCDRRVSAVQRVGYRLLTQARTHHQQVLRLGRDDRHCYLEEMAAARQEERASRENFTNLYTQMLDILRELVIAVRAPVAGPAETQAPPPPVATGASATPSASTTAANQEQGTAEDIEGHAGEAGCG